MVPMWMSEDNSVTLVLSFCLYTGVPGIELRLPGLHDMYFYMLSHLLSELTSKELAILWFYSYFHAIIIVTILLVK